MNEYNKLLELTDSKTVELGSSFKNLLGTWLQLGMSNYVVRNGTLSEGFEKLLPAQIYAQAIKEMYNLSNNIRSMKATAMEAQADLMDAEYEIEHKSFDYNPQDKMRAEVKVMRAKDKLVNALVTVEDQVRQLKEFDKVRQELEPEVLSKYKCIEDAEPENWEAVLKYRIAKNRIKDTQFVCHVPMPKDEKAKVAIKYDAPEAATWVLVADEKEINENFGGNIQKFLAAKEGSNVLSMEDKKWQKTTGLPSGPTLA